MFLNKKKLFLVDWDGTLNLLFLWSARFNKTNVTIVKVVQKFMQNRSVNKDGIFSLTVSCRSKSICGTNFRRMNVQRVTVNVDVSNGRDCRLEVFLRMRL